MTSISSHAGEDVRVGLDTSEEGVATRAEQSANFARPMAMVDVEISRDRTDSTPPTLRDLHGFNVGRRESVFTPQTRTEILSPSGFGVGLAPGSQAFVSSRLVGLGVGTGPSVRAIAAVRPQVGAGLGERGLRKLLQAIDALPHRLSVTQSRDMDDQPCHADVLLEWANGDAS